MQRLCLSLSLVAAVIMYPVHADTLTDGSLFLNVGTNGAIHTVRYDGAYWFNFGTPVSDWGLSVEGAFYRNTSEGSMGWPTISALTDIPVGVSSMGGAIRISGEIGGIGIERSYTLIPGLNVMRISTTLTNQGSTTVNLTFFDSYDPDPSYYPDVYYSTYMDKTSLMTPAGAAVLGEAWRTSPAALAMVLGTLDPDAVVSAGPSYFSMLNLTALTNMMAAPEDGGGGFYDGGVHIGWQLTLDSGGVRTIGYDMAFANTLTGAETAFAAANPAAVPEPPIAALMGLALVLTTLKLRRQRVVDRIT